jgi:hypothetical protein
MMSLDVLEAALSKLSERDRTFANSLINQGRRHGLSSTQMYWVGELTKRASQPIQAAKPREQVGDLNGVLSLFDTAQKHLKRPAIVLHIPQVGEVRISVAGERSRVPGSLNVADNAAYGQGNWYGRILRDGTFEPSRVETPAELMPALRDFAERPAEAAAEHGRLMGKCCFCERPLTDERSTAVGYGATCAKHYSLPYPTSREVRRPRKLATRAHDDLLLV